MEQREVLESIGREAVWLYGINVAENHQKLMEKLIAGRGSRHLIYCMEEIQEVVTEVAKAVSDKPDMDALSEEVTDAMLTLRTLQVCYQWKDALVFDGIRERLQPSGLSEEMGHVIDGIVNKEEATMWRIVQMLSGVAKQMSKAFRGKTGPGELLPFVCDEIILLWCICHFYAVSRKTMIRWWNMKLDKLLDAKDLS